ncbi:MAG: DUF5005 domain-containing protein [Prevotella sp.]|jgi:hypothetical protein|nr:DUF5005 domain-containing protein [Prevotella sp.]
MKRKPVFLLLLAALFSTSLKSQNIVASNYSQFDLALNWDGAAVGGSTRMLFGLLLPQGWRVADKGGDFSVAFSNGSNADGQFAFCQFYSDYLSANNETPAGYYWWGGRAIDKIQFNSRIQFDLSCSLKILTDEKTGDFLLKFAVGEDPSNTIRTLYVGEAFQVTVNQEKAFPAQRSYNWQQIEGSFAADYYSDKDFDGFFERYYGWNGGDVAMSTLLPDGRSIWTWGDYDVGVVNSERNRLTELAQFPRNALMLQDGCDYSAFSLLTNGKKLGQIEPAIRYCDNNGNPLPDGDEWYWPMGGHIYYRNGFPELQVLLEHTVNAGGGQWGMEGVGVDVAVFSLPDLQLQRVAKNCYTGKVGFGNIAFGDDDGVVYIYGERNFGICVGATYVARNLDGDLTGTWEFYDAATGNWTTGHAWAEIDEGSWWEEGHQLINNALFVFKDGGKYFAFEQEPCFSPNSFVYDAESPVGPFTNRRKVGVLPAEITSNNFICYIPTLHQQFSKDGELLYSVSKNYNGDFDRYGGNQSANYYLPYFFRVKHWRDKLNIVENALPLEPAVASEPWLAAEYQAMDNKANTVFSAQMQEGGVCLTGVLPQKTLLRQYTITSAPDSPEKDPLHWQLLGSNDYLNWTVLDERYYAVFEERGQTNTYTVPLARTMQYFRLNVLTANDADVMQIAEWQLFGKYAGFDYQGNLSVEKKETGSFRIYPNPVGDELIIVAGAYAERPDDKLSIMDLSGKTLISQKLPAVGSRFSISVRALPAGMYLARLGGVSAKFVKK